MAPAGKVFDGSDDLWRPYVRAVLRSMTAGLDGVADWMSIGVQKLVGAVQDDILGKIWKDRLVVIAVGRCREATPCSRLKVVLARRPDNG